MKKLHVFVLLLFISIPLARAQIQAALSVGRTAGVAPLTVFFDATGTSDPSVTGRPFHELEYRWNFGDVAPTWTRGSRAGVSSKNVATGPMAAHVYERPGTYLATLAVFDGRNTTSRQVSITVADPNAVFAGAQTVCFSTGVRGFSGCPASARHIRTTDFAGAINTYKGSAKRLLFRRGETFRSAATAIVNVDGPGIIGAFGALNDPLPVLQSTANGVTIQMSSNRTPGLHDWRVMDLNLLGNGGNLSYGVSFGGGINQVTLLRLSTQRQRIGVIADAFVLDWYNRSSATAGHKAWDQLALVDSTISSVNHGTGGTNVGYGTFMSGERFFYAGNWIDNAGTATGGVSHCARFPYLAKAIISDNTLMHPGPSEHLIKLHAPGWTTNGVGHNGIGQGYSRWVIISENHLLGAYNNWLVAVGPQNAQSDERVRDVITERNWFVAGPGMQVGEIFFASEVTSRNNIVDASAGSGSQTGTWVGKRGVEPPPSQIRIFNDTYYSAKPGAQFAGITLESTVTYVTAKNNVAYAPRANNPLMFRNGCGACLTQSNNSTNAQAKVNLPFAVGTPVSPLQFKAAGYTVGSGTLVPIWSDFFLINSSTVRRDMGAVFH